MNAAIISRFGDPARYDLSDADVVLMRQDPPFDMAYITATHLLETHPSRDAGRERSFPCPQRARKTFRHEFQGYDAAEL